MKQPDKTPVLYIWKDQLLFIGISVVPHREHHVVQDKLMVSIEGDIRLTFSNGSQMKTRSILLRAGTRFDKRCIDVSNATIAIYYIAPLSQDFPYLESCMTPGLDDIYHDHPREPALISCLKKVRDEALSPETTYQVLREFILPESEADKTFREFDHRAVQVLRSVRETVSENRSIQEFASMVNLSASRLEKLFKEYVGVPITNYRLRYRVFVAVIQIALGQSVTNAALAAGFASSAHFSKTFTKMNGIPPSETFFKPPFLSVKIAEEVYRTASLLAERYPNSPEEKCI